MRLHKEGFVLIPLILVILALVLGGIYFVLESTSWFFVFYFCLIAGIIFFGLVLNFFRDPVIQLQEIPDGVLSPCDGKVVAIEEVEEKTFLQTKVRQVSIFMSPLDVHVNRAPVGGKVIFSRYYPGKFLVAWHPKSSEENERTYVVIQSGEDKIGFKQIAGAVAKRIRCYVREGDQIGQGMEFGFIRFGSRMDVLLPLSYKTTIILGQKVKGGITPIARKAS